MNFVLVLSKLPLKSACLKYRVARNCFVGSNFCDFFHDLQKKFSHRTFLRKNIPYLQNYTYKHHMYTPLLEKDRLKVLSATLGQVIIVVE